MSDDVLNDVALACRLREGAEGVRALLQVVHKHGKIPLRQAAIRIGLPLPVAAAVRRELEKRGLLTRDAGMTLSELGARFASEELDLGDVSDFVCPVCEGRLIALGPDIDPLIERVQSLFRARAPVDVTLDQSHNTPQSAVRRACFMVDRGAVEGRAVVFLGDDDLMSVAVACAVMHLKSGAPARLCVVDIDDRVLDSIGALSDREGLGIECVRHDLRCPLPEGMRGVFDTFFTDPPHTLDGATVFVSRAAEALRDEPMKQGFLSIGRKDPSVTAELHVRLGQMGLAVSQVIPAFTEYEGASMIGGTSQMIHVVSTASTRPYFALPYDGGIYTADDPERQGGRGGPRASSRTRGGPTP